MLDVVGLKSGDFYVVWTPVVDSRGPEDFDDSLSTEVEYL